MAFDPNEVRDEKGRWSSSGGASPPNASDKLWAVAHGDPNGPYVQVENLDNAPQARAVAKQSAEVAKALGFPPTKINVSDGEYKFTVNGKEMTAAGLAYRDTGLITMFSKQLTPQSLPGIMAHEIMHQKYNAYTADVKAQFDHLMTIEAEYKANGRDFWREVMKPSGQLFEPYASSPQFSLYHQNQLLQLDDERMRKEDGCSAYSKEYWEAYGKGESSIDKPYHETLAEMARIDYENKVIKKADAAREAEHTKNVADIISRGGKWDDEDEKEYRRNSPGPRVGQYALQMAAPPMLKKTGFFTAKPSPRWVALYKAVNANWDKKVKAL